MRRQAAYSLLGRGVKQSASLFGVNRKRFFKDALKDAGVINSQLNKENIMKLPKVSGGVGRIETTSTVESQYIMLSAWRGISVGDVLDPGGIIRDTAGRWTGGTSVSYSNEQLKNFTACMGFPNESEAEKCLGSLLICSPAAAAAGIGYGVCVGAACGVAGATHANRCAREVGIIGGGSSGGSGGGGGGSNIRDFRGGRWLPEMER